METLEQKQEIENNVGTLEQERELDEETISRVSFYTFMINEYASKYRISRRLSYKYLKEFGGLDYMKEHWWALHTDTPEWALEFIDAVCLFNGGTR